MMSLFLLFIFFINRVYSISCSSYQAETACISNSGGSCLWLNNKCRCASEVLVDIYFAIDTSGSIGWTDFQIEKWFLSGLVTQGVGSSSRLAFNMFSTTTNESRGLQLWPDEDVLLAYVSGIRWTGGWTNTAAVTQNALDQFANYGDADRQAILMIITDGNPCDGSVCPYEVCGFRTAILRADIRVIIVGVGNGWQEGYVGCLTQQASDVIKVESFSQNDFDSVLSDLFDILCPISMNVVITEVKPMRVGKNNTVAWRCDRFVEIYNSGIEFYTNLTLMTGVVTGFGTGGAVTNTLLPRGKLIAQGQYLVYYDAETGYPPGETGKGEVSCHLCVAITNGGLCDLTNCAGTTAQCYCENSEYIACAATVSSSNEGAYQCYFNYMTSTSWNVHLLDSIGAEIDSVTYDANTWIVVMHGYAYELTSKGFDNDDGSNWSQSCDQFGTPGTDPGSDCSIICTDQSCASGGSSTSTCLTSGQCECDPATGYYPHCSGGSCYTCREIPTSEQCFVTWTKNGTQKIAYYDWTDVSWAANVTYRLSYFSQSGGGSILTKTTNGATFFPTTNFYTSNVTYGGFVQTVVTVCYERIIGDGVTCEQFASNPVWCTVITAAPSKSPTPAPTVPPTPAPSSPPTLAPTLPCPFYYFDDSRFGSGKICEVERCLCTNADYGGDCCIEIDASQSTDPLRPYKYHDDTAICWIDGQFEDGSEGRIEYLEDEDDDLLVPGYLLARTTHYINIIIDTIDGSAYPCLMEICWEFEFERCSNTYGGTGTERRRLGTSTDEDCDVNDISTVGLAINVDVNDISHLQKCLVVNGSTDIAAAVVEFTVTQPKVLNSQASSRAIYGYLTMTNATSLCNATVECTDKVGEGRIYPMRIPVWYSKSDADALIPSNEEPLPAWIWWLIAAMACFLIILGCLVYKYWWAQKKTGAALSAAQGDLDEAITEAECGWANNLDGNGAGFNPLATGFNPNTGAPAGNPNAPIGNNGGSSQFVKGQVERTVFRNEFGPSTGKRN